MKSRIQIILSGKPRPQQQESDVRRAPFILRLKTLGIGVSFFTVAIAVLIVAIVIGSLLAVLVSIGLLTAVLVVMAKLAFLRRRT